MSFPFSVRSQAVTSSVKPKSELNPAASKLEFSLTESDHRKNVKFPVRFVE
jgi:hypothetical protein